MSETRDNDASQPRDIEHTTSSLLRFANQIQSALYRQAKGMIGPRLGAKYSASDAVQEAVVRVLQQSSAGELPHGQQGVTRFRRFARALRDVVRNAVRHFRREGRSLDREIPWQTTSSRGAAYEPGRSASGLQRVEQVDQRDYVLSQISDDERELLILRVEQQHSFEDMAVKLQCSVDAVKKRYYRAASHLETILDRLEQRDDRGTE